MHALRRPARERHGHRPIAIRAALISANPVAVEKIPLRHGGTVAVPGVEGGNAIPNFDTDQLILKGLTVRGALGVPSFAYREAVRLLSEGTVPFERMHSGTSGLASAEEAILTLAGRGNRPPVISVSIAPNLTGTG